MGIFNEFVSKDGKKLIIFILAMCLWVQICEIQQKTDINYRMLAVMNPELHQKLVPEPTTFMEKGNYFLTNK